MYVPVCPPSMHEGALLQEETRPSKWEACGGSWDEWFLPSTPVCLRPPNKAST